MGKYIQTAAFTGSGFQTLAAYDGWKVCFSRYSENASSAMKRHLKTDEVFVLLAGSAALYVEDESVQMEHCKVYTVKKGLWHRMVLSQDATVLVVENSGTTAENTETRCEIC